MKRIFVLLLFGFVMIGLTGCPSMGGKSFDQMSPKEKVIQMYSIYNSQYNDYMSMMGYIKGATGEWEQISTPSLTDEQREILRFRKKILTKVYPLIKLYDTQSQGGAGVSRETEAEIMRLLNQL